jgi:hypothetical protein
MKNYVSNTTNGGNTIILDSLEEAIEIGKNYLASRLKECDGHGPGEKFLTRTIIRDKEPERHETNYGDWKKGIEQRQTDFAACVEAIVKGDPAMNQVIMDKSENLVDLVTAIEPSLVGSYVGFERSEDGVAVDPGLIAAGEDRPFFKRRQSRDTGRKQGREGRGYRIILSTDTTWFGDPRDNAAMVGAMVYLLQQFGPVEVWIQQGWLGPEKGNGVTLFTLDFSKGFDATQLAFWIGHRLKDSSFSFEINLSLGRNSAGTAKYAELPADVYLRGDWMRVYGMDERFDRLLHTERLDLMTKWIAETAMKVVNGADEGGDGTMALDD